MRRRPHYKGLNPTGKVTLFIFVCIFFLLFGAVFLSFAKISFSGYARGVNLHDFAEARHWTTGITTARRGTILDQNGNVLAREYPSYNLYANLNPNWGSAVDLNNVDEVSRQLSTVINMSAEDIAWNLSQENVYRVEFGLAGQRLTFAEKLRINELGLSGFHFEQTLTRFYPAGIFASHTLGYTFHHPDNPELLVGAMGIESYFNELLTGTDGRYEFKRDRDGFLQPGQERLYIDEPKDGYDIYLTINGTIQNFLETAMNRVQDEQEPEMMVAVVMHARTGKILATASRPTFDPNLRNPIDYENAMVTRFEPGSTIKSITYAAAINQGVYHGHHVFRSGTRDLHGTTIRDFSLGWGEMTFDEAFFRSSNTAIIDLFRNGLSFERWLHYLDGFGFNETTNLPLHGEQAGFIPPIYGSPVDLYMSGYGQAISVTPIQQVQALTPFLNNGQLIRPQLVYRIYNPNTGVAVQTFEREVVGQPITEATANQMKDLLIGVVDNPIGTGYINYRLEVPSGGKTGTAQVAGPFGYIDGVHIYSYVGFAPVDDPELIMFIALKNPETERPSGHFYAGYIYRFVMDNALRYLGLTPMERTKRDPNDIAVFVEVPHVLNLELDEAKAKVEGLGLEPIVVGEGNIVFRQEPFAGLNVTLGDKIFLQVGTEDRLPNMRGWTRAQVVQYMRLMGIEVNIVGSGRVTEQSIRRGTVVSGDETITITLE